MAVGGLCVFLAMLWVGLQSVIVAFPGHTRLFFNLLPTNVVFLKATFNTVMMFHYISRVYRVHSS